MSHKSFFKVDIVFELLLWPFVLFSSLFSLHFFFYIHRNVSQMKSIVLKTKITQRSQSKDADDFYLFTDCRTKYLMSNCLSDYNFNKKSIRHIFFCSYFSLVFSIAFRLRCWFFYFCSEVRSQKRENGKWNGISTRAHSCSIVDWYAIYFSCFYDFRAYLKWCVFSFLFIPLYSHFLSDFFLPLYLSSTIHPFLYVYFLFDCNESKERINSKFYYLENIDHICRCNLK